MKFYSKAQTVIILVFIAIQLSLLPTALYAQGGLDVVGRLLVKRSSTSGAIIVVIKDGVEESRNQPGRGGRFDFTLKFDADYILSFEKEGYVSKKISINTVIPSDYKDKKNVIDFEVELEPQTATSAIKTYNNPVAKIRYEKRKGDFAYDTDYSASFRRDLAAEEEKLVQEAKDEAIAEEKEKIAQAAEQRKLQEENQRKAAEQARIAEVERKRKEAEARTLAEAKAKEQARIKREEEQRREAERQRLAQAARKKAEEEALLAEQERFRQEAERIRQQEEQARLQQQQEEMQKQAEQAKLAEQRRLQEEAERTAAEQARLAEAERKRKEAEALALAEAKAKEEARLAEQERVRQEAERIRQQEEQIKQKQQESQLQRQAELAKEAEQRKLQEEVQRQAAEQARIAEAEKKRLEAEALALSEAKAKEKARLAEQERIRQETERIRKQEEQIRQKLHEEQLQKQVKMGQEAEHRKQRTLASLSIDRGNPLPVEDIAEKYSNERTVEKIQLNKIVLTRTVFNRNGVITFYTLVEHENGSIYHFKNGEIVSAWHYNNEVN